MKRKYLMALTALLYLTFTSCQDLDTLPSGNIVTDDQKKDIYEKDPQKAAAGVNAIFAQFSQYGPNYKALKSYRHNDFGYGSIMMFTDANGYDVISDDNGYNWAGNSLDFSDRVFTTNESQIVWNDLYKQIFVSNNVIRSIEADTDDNTKKYYLAQGLAVRAFSYLTLAQLYQFNYVGHESSACVPIITDANSTEAAFKGASRATVKEVYDLINADISKSVELLGQAEKAGIKRSDKRYVSLAVAHGIRARMHLAMHKWSEAAADASAAIAASDAVPASVKDVSVPAFWTVAEKNWMWGIVVAETDEIVTSGIVNWISHMGSLNWGYANYSKGRQINKKLYESIPATDVRKGWWLDAQKVSANLNDEQQKWMTAKRYPAYTQVKFAPYKNEVGTTTNANDLPLMRIEEMYLIKAEAEAMSGADGKATLVSFMQQFRDPAYTTAASSPLDVQEEVFRQRRIELWGEGLNWFDIMRLNKGVDRRGCGFPNATMIFNVPANDNILLWRIPESEIQANPALNESDNNPSSPAPNPVAE